jgi:taurine dioxygenase
MPQARHPIVRTHPETGGEMLYVNPVFGRYICDIAEGEDGAGVPMDHGQQSDAILSYLYKQANHPEYNFSYVYRPGDMTFVSGTHPYHNRCLTWFRVSSGIAFSCTCCCFKNSN